MHALRHVVASDHEGVSAMTLGESNKPERNFERDKSRSHGPKQQRHPDQISKVLVEAEKAVGDSLQHIQRVVTGIAEPKRNTRTYRESGQMKNLRRRAKQAREGQTSRTFWKQVWRLRTKEREQWKKDLLEAALREDWHALRAAKAAKRAYVWEEELTAKDRWEESMRAHFNSILAKTQEVRRGLQQIWDQLSIKCKTTRWRPFTPEELVESAKTWSRRAQD